MQSAIYDMRGDRGVAFKRIFTLQQPDGNPVNLSGCSISGELRENLKQVAPTAAFDCEITDASLGKVTFRMTAEQTAALKAMRYAYFIDVHYVDGEPQRLLRGVITMEG